MEGLLRIDPGIPDHRWHSVLVFNRRWPGTWIHQLRGCERMQRSRSRNQLADLSARRCARDVFHLCAKQNGLGEGAALLRPVGAARRIYLRLPPAPLRAIAKMRLLS